MRIKSQTTRSICIIGGGPVGISAAYYLSRLCKQRARITILEASNKTGGLAGSHKLANGEYIESYYHHIFQTDHSFMQLCNLVGISNEIFFKSVSTGHYYKRYLYNLGGPADILKETLLLPSNRIRFLAASLYLKLGFQRRFKNKNALEGSRILYGKEVTQKIWEPLLEGKFGEFKTQVPMSWLASRIRDRSLRLGYFNGGFHRFYESIASSCQKEGVSLKYNTEALSLSINTDKVEVNGVSYDACLSTIGPVLEERLLDQIPNIPIKYLGAICVVYEFDGSLAIPYWTNYCDPESPVLAVINHRELDSDKRLGNCCPVYTAAYLRPDSELFALNDNDVVELFYKPIQAVANVAKPCKMPSLIRATVYRTKYAQPLINPDIGLHPLIRINRPFYSASMHSIYPNDRGQNYAVETGKSIAMQIARDLYGR